MQTTACAVIYDNLMNTNKRLSFFSLHERTDTFRAQDSTNQPAIFKHADGLKVRTERPQSRFFGPRAAQAERSFLTTVSALRHCQFPFDLHNIPTYHLCAPKNTWDARSLAEQYYHKLALLSSKEMVFHV